MDRARRESRRGTRRQDGRPSAGRRGNSGRRPGFLRWYRVVPAVLLVVTLLVCALPHLMPTTVGRSYYPVSYAQEIEDAAGRYGVDPLLVCAVIKCESGWDSSAVSSVGAQGLMQLMPETAADLVEMGLVDGTAYDATDLTNPTVNIEYGCAYLGFLQKNLSSTQEIIAAYNAGIGTVLSWLEDGGSVPDNISYVETRVYLERVQEAYEGYAQAYPSGIAAASER